MIDYVPWLELQKHHFFYCTFICFSFWNCKHLPHICSFSYIVWKNAVELVSVWSIAFFCSCFHIYDCKLTSTSHLNKNYEQISQWYTKWAKLIWWVVAASDGNDSYMFNFCSNCNIRSKEEVKVEKKSEPEGHCIAHFRQ